MSGFDDARTVVRILRNAITVRRARRELREALAARPELPTDTFEAVIYFADKRVNLYQMRQWYQPMRRLAEKHPVAVISRSIVTTQILLEECPLPVFYAPKIVDMENFIAEQPIKAAFYVNQNMRNFQMMRFPGMYHVLVGHGESDKISMASNQVKAYDYAFIAGQAAEDRITSRLLDVDLKRLIKIGRPQVDVESIGPSLPQDQRTVVLYAPTWEGDRPSMSYGSVASHGIEIVSSLVRTGTHRVIYRPHPRTGVYDPAFAAAGQRIASIMTEANRTDPGAGHLVDTESPFGWHLRAAHACICDISAVAFDWLATGKPLLLTLPTTPDAVVAEDGITGVVAKLSADQAGQAAELIDKELAGGADAYRAISEHYFGDTSSGASMQRFLDACYLVMAERDKAAALMPAATMGAPRHPGGRVHDGSVPQSKVEMVEADDAEGLSGLDS